MLTCARVFVASPAHRRGAARSNGVMVKDAAGAEYGRSKVAGRRAISQVMLTRVALPLPGASPRLARPPYPARDCDTRTYAVLLLPPFFLAGLQSAGAMPRNPRLRLLLELGACGAHARGSAVSPRCAPAPLTRAAAARSPQWCAPASSGALCPPPLAYSRRCVHPPAARLPFALLAERSCPAAAAAVAQNASIGADELEPEFRDLHDASGRVIDTFYFNKGV